MSYVNKSRNNFTKYHEVRSICLRESFSVHLKFHCKRSFDKMLSGFLIFIFPVTVIQQSGKGSFLRYFKGIWNDDLLSKLKSYIVLVAFFLTIIFPNKTFQLNNITRKKRRQRRIADGKTN